jgi:hypothetical protein
MAALLRWTVFCVVTDRRPRLDTDTSMYFAIADDESLSYDAKITAYLALADDHFDTARYWQWCAENLSHLDEQVHDWVTSKDFERLLRETVDATYPESERDRFMAHFKGLTDLWAADNAP